MNTHEQMNTLGQMNTHRRMNSHGEPKPRVTVLMPVYNREAYVRQSIDSILAQRFDDFELLVVDDGSTDESVALVRSIDDPRIRLVESESNAGAAHARNVGIGLARGEYIAMQDSDDWSRPDRLEKQVAYLDVHLRCALVGSWWEIMDAEGRDTGAEKHPPCESGDIRVNLLFSGCLLNSTTLVRTDVIRELEFDSSYIPGEDIELWIRLGERHELAVLPEYLLRYRDHHEGISKTETVRAITSYLAMVGDQLDALGVSYTEDDIHRHRLLRNTKEADIDPAYLEWAREWLERLLTANYERGYYPQEPFKRILGEKWLNACVQAVSRDGIGAVRTYGSSSLCTAGLASYGIKLAGALERRVKGRM